VQGKQEELEQRGGRQAVAWAAMHAPLLDWAAHSLGRQLQLVGCVVLLYGSVQLSSMRAVARWKDVPAQRAA
jgi:hypothetical protein